MPEKKGKETVIVNTETGVDEEKNRGGKKWSWNTAYRRS